MNTLQEALSKSMIKKLEKHSDEFKNIIKKFTKADLENGDLLYESKDRNFWMYLDSDEVQKRLSEFEGSKSSKTIKDLKEKKPFLVCPAFPIRYRQMYNIFRQPIDELYNANGNIYGGEKHFIFLIKCNNKYYDENKTINEIFAENNDFVDYKKLIDNNEALK